MSVQPGQYAHRGITFGDDTPYVVQSIEGLDLPPYRTMDVPNAGADGDTVGVDYLGSREIVIALEVVDEGDASGLHEALSALRLAFAPATDLQPFEFNHPPNPPLVAFCRPRGVIYRLERKSTGGVATAAVRLYAPSPTLFADVEQSASTSPYGAGSGHRFPHQFPLRFVGSGGETNQSVAICVNGGNTPTYPVIVLQGPVDRPILENIVTGEIFQLNYNMSTADTFNIDMAAHTVLLEGISSFRGAVTPSSLWLSLVPGTNEIRFRSVGVAGDSASATVYWRDAYL